MNKKTTDQYREILSDDWISISDSEFVALKELVYKKIGINLTDDKRNLVMGRLQKILRAKSFANFRQYYDYVITDKTGYALGELANNISTNHTFFYRENDHFEFFANTVLPQIDSSLKASGRKDIRVWSAGCSSGEEPYLLVMLMMDYFGSRYQSLDAGVLATDISEKALNIAKAGIYDEGRLKQLPEKYLKKYFKQISPTEWEVKDIVKKEVLYRKFNLMNEVFKFKNQFHVIFCRNVMIYFDEKTRNELVRKFQDLIMLNGYLFIGHSETINKKLFNLQFVMPALYRKTK
jgi:chemotaxis protein methyltransferase CheR